MPRVLHTAAFLTVLLTVTAPAAAAAQNVKVVPGEVTDDRYSQGTLTGALRIELGIDGDGRDAIKAARFLPKEAKDDAGASLLPKTTKEAGFDKVDSQMRVRVNLVSPSRKARSFRLSGKLELFVPSKDPNAVVKVPGALAQKDKPLKAPGLKAAKVEVTLLSKAAYQDVKKKQKFDDAKIAEVRAEGKRRGVSEKEIEMMIGLAKAMQEMDAEVPESAVILHGKLQDMERVVDVALEKPDGTAIDIPGRTSTSDGQTTSTVLQTREAPPADAVLVLTLLTDKAKVALPVDLKDVPLP